jgi:uncharacterized membrane protein YfcA
MENSFIFWCLAVLASVFVGMGKGGLPAIAALAVPSMSLFISPIAAAGLLLPVYIVSDIFALSAYRRDFDKSVLKISIIGMTIGVVLGGLTAHIIIDWIVTALIGLISFLFALQQIFNQSRDKISHKINNKRGYFWCTVSGFTSFISHTGGPPWQIFVLPIGLKKSIFVGTSVIAFSYCNLIKLIPYIWLGQLNITSFKMSLLLMLPASLAVFAGVKIVKIIPEPLFFKIIVWALLLISIKLMADGIRVPLGF